MDRCRPLLRDTDPRVPAVRRGGPGNPRPTGQGAGGGGRWLSARPGQWKRVPAGREASIRAYLLLPWNSRALRRTLLSQERRHHFLPTVPPDAAGDGAGRRLSSYPWGWDAVPGRHSPWSQWPDSLPQLEQIPMATQNSWRSCVREPCPSLIPWPEVEDFQPSGSAVLSHPAPSVSPLLTDCVVRIVCASLSPSLPLHVCVCACSGNAVLTATPSTG